MGLKKRDLLLVGVKRLKDAGVMDAAYDARELLKAAFGWNTEEYLLSLGREIADDEESQAATFNRWIKKRASREPLQHILGYAWLMGLKFMVSPQVLIPRTDTEVLCEVVFKYEKNRNVKVLDLGTGSGCIAIVLKKIGGFKSVAASDVSVAALEMARENTKMHGVCIDFIQSDLFENVVVRKDGTDREGFDIIVSNPPYISAASIETLSAEVRDHDPHLALDGGKDGLDFYRRIALGCRKKVLKSGGRLYLEIGFDQADAVMEILKRSGFCDITVFKDLAGWDRVVAAKKLSPMEMMIDQGKDT